jgi:hypothetical protein
MTAKLSLSICLSGLLVVLVSGCRSTCCSSKTLPAVYKIAFENDQIRVIEYHTGSEKGICGYGMHTHPPHAYIMLTDGRLRIVTPDGKEVVENAKAGDVGWADAEEHIAENLSGNNAGCYVIEIKGKDWKPSTGLAK